MDQMRDLEVGGLKSLNNHLIGAVCAHFCLQSIVISSVSVRPPIPLA